MVPSAGMAVLAVALWTVVCALLAPVASCNHECGLKIGSTDRASSRRLLQAAVTGGGAAAEAQGLSTIKKCLWSSNVGCALNPSFMFTINEVPDSYERCVPGNSALCTIDAWQSTMHCQHSDLGISTCTGIPCVAHTCTCQYPPDARVLLQITAMRYACLNHATEDDCHADVRQVPRAWRAQCSCCRR